jgi:hypothetical protein
MTMSKMTLLGAVVVVAVVIGSGTLAWVHNGAATADHKKASYVVGPDGRSIGAAPNPSIRSQWERDGLPN